MINELRIMDMTDDKLTDIVFTAIKTVKEIVSVKTDRFSSKLELLVNLYNMDFNDIDTFVQETVKITISEDNNGNVSLASVMPELQPFKHYNKLIERYIFDDILEGIFLLSFKKQVSYLIRIELSNNLSL